MKLADPAHNKACIACGGAVFVYEAHQCDISRICDGDRGLALAISRESISTDWRFPSECQVSDALIEAAGGSELLARLLAKRGLSTPADAEAYLNPTKYQPSPPDALPDMDRAVARIAQAIAGQEKVTIYGDYDVDGVTATAVMVTTLRTLGADVDFYIPSRAEGYGLNLKAVSVLASKQRTKLLITCDCGISNFSEINFARSLGVDTIVVDHHTMPELMPPASAILHPKRLDETHPLFHLPGVGVAYKLAEALFIEHNQKDEIPRLLDFVTLGMIADMVPLTQECRYLVQVGMPQLVHSQRAGIKALLAQVGPKDGSTDLVGFGLAPRINAVGRLSDANLAVKLMITDDNDEAVELARQLEYENLRRQELCEEIFEKADQMVQRKRKPTDRCIAIFDVGWHHGVVGIVASRLVEKYNCPVFIGELDTDEGIVKGSARGIPAIDMYEVLKANEHLAMKWGGHKMAAGFSVERGKADLFCAGLIDTCNAKLADQPMTRVLDIDLEVDPDSVTMDLAEILSKMAPFGIGNKRPVLALRDTSCVNTRPLGKEGKHSRVIVGAGGQQFECVFWNSRGRVPADKQTIDVAFAPEINVYKGNSRLQLLLNDWRDPSQPAVPAALPAVRTTPAPAVVSQTVPVDTSSATSFAPPVGKERDISSNAGAVQNFAPAPTVAPRDANLGAPAARSNANAETWKDLRNHSAPDSLLQAATRKLGASVSIFAETANRLAGMEFLDRTALKTSGHLIIWSLPPSLPVLKEILTTTSAQHVYFIGVSQPTEDAAGFLKKLLGLVRYAVNQREGQAQPDKVAAVLGSSKMAVALGLTILKKIEVIDWFAEDGMLNLDLIGQPVAKPEEVLEFRQLANCLREIDEFRAWCQKAELSEIQLALVPNPGAEAVSFEPPDDSNEETGGLAQNDTANELSSNFS